MKMIFVKTEAKCVNGKAVRGSILSHTLTCHKTCENEEEREAFSLCVSLGDEEIIFDDITSLRDVAYEIFLAFSAGAVTPCGSCDVLYELLP